MSITFKGTDIDKSLHLEDDRGAQSNPAPSRYCSWAMSGLHATECHAPK